MGDLTEDAALRTQKDYKWEGILDNICTLDVDCNVGADRADPSRAGRLHRSGPNECLYQFVSIVFEYFRSFVTILIPCGRRGPDRCFLFNILRFLLLSPFDRTLVWLIEGVWGRFEFVYSQYVIRFKTERVLLN